MRELKITIADEEKINQIEEKNDTTELKEKFHKLFKTNTTIKDIKVDIYLKPGARIIQLKEHLIPILLKDAFGKEMRKLQNSGHFERGMGLTKTALLVQQLIPQRKTNR